MDNNKILVTVVTSTFPSVVTKRFRLEDGVLTKTTSGNLAEGTFEVVALDDLNAFGGLLAGLAPNQCLVYGVPAIRKGRIMTEAAWLDAGRPADAVPRTTSAFQWHAGPGVMMLDYDKPKDGTPALTREQLEHVLEPILGANDLAWWPSTSSCLYDGDTELSGVEGQRFYVAVKDARDIPRAGELLNALLWSQGLGRFEVSKAGTLLERGLFDGAVWQTNRIDFAAGACCEGGLEQRRGSPVITPGLFDKTADTKQSLRNLTTEQLASAKANKAAARAMVQSTAELVREEWIAERRVAMMKANPDLTADAANSTLRQAIDRRELGGDFEISVVGDRGRIEKTTVLNILDNPAKYHGAKTLDPLEPGYDGSKVVGKLFLFSARPTLNSMAHGQAVYRLQRQPQKVELVAGKRNEAVDQTLELLRASPDTFDFGDTIATLDSMSRVRVLNDRSIGYHLAGITQFYARKKVGENEGIVYRDPPERLCTDIVQLGIDRRLKQLDAVITAPTLRADGSVLDTLGYDAQSRLLFDTKATTLPVPSMPTANEANLAYETVMAPFKDFPFVEPIDRAVLLAAILSACIRPALPSSPAFAFDAPAQGSGKTLLARCVGAIALGEEPALWPHITEGDAEIRKRIFSALRGGDRVIIWDNLVGAFDSAALGAALTAPLYVDRVLGQSTDQKIPNRSQILFTGNNIVFTGDMTRRVFICRIDPRQETPYAREFDVDPFAFCVANRQEIVSAALTLIRFYLSAGVERPGKGRTASFELWDDMVRQTVIYLDRTIAAGKLGDVLVKINESMAVDPTKDALFAMLENWNSLFGDRELLVNEILEEPTEPLAENPDRDAMLAAMTELYGRDLSPKRLGKGLREHVGVVIGGYRLDDCRGRKRHKSQLWRVENVEIA